MPEFSYKIRDKSGKNPIQGQAEAKNMDSLVSRLQEKGYIVIEIAPALKPKTHGETKEVLTNVTLPSVKGKKYHSKIKLDDLTLFTRQLATLLEAGVTLLKALEIIQEQLDSRKLYVITEQIKLDISSGFTLRDALARHPKVFSEFWLNLVETGEASGHLSLALGHLAKYLETKGQLQSRVVSALMYPMVLAVVLIVVLSVFLLKIVPIFENLYGGFNVALPLLTQWVINLSRLLRDHFLIIFLSVIGFGVLFYKYIHTAPGKWNFDKYILKIPVLGSLLHQVAISRFAGGLSTLIQAGVPILFALDIISKSTGNKLIEKAIEGVRASVKEGKTMAEPLKKSGYFPPMVVQMVGVGEEVGELGSMLDKVYAYYEERISTMLNRLTTLFEPIMLVIMGVVVGFLVVAMYLPIFSLASSMR